MNIFALENHKVIVTEETSKCGFQGDQEQVQKLLEVGKEYTVDSTIVGGSYTTVILKEFPKTYFNSVMFEDVIPQSEEDDAKHMDYDGPHGYVDDLYEYVYKSDILSKKENKNA
jgi:predicted small secreted protein